MLVGVDIGGTFTDFCLSRDGRLHVHKVLSTPHDPAQAMLAGLNRLSPYGIPAIRRIVHGSTVATNAILERRGASTALVTTQGFQDILFIGRQNRSQLYALQPQAPPPLIPRQRCYEVPERLDHTGAILRPLDMEALDAILEDIAREGVEALAVCLLYSYVNPVHEQAVRARALERRLLPAERIALSCEVLPEFREYERASTVALEAYVRPVVEGYLGRLEAAVARGGGAPDWLLIPDEDSAGPSLRIMKSDGGAMSAQRARRRAVQTALSGPAAGVIGGFYLAQQAGYEQVITLDMGGTSTDVAVCPGELVLRTESEIDGLPLRTRLLDIETIGAGGGSLVRLDVGGALRVGPESAGADPGPIVYGLGGTELTVTDADAFLGRLDPDHFLGGSMPLYLELARRAIGALAAAIGVGPLQAALGIVDVANANIDRAVRRVSIARGHDPRQFTLVAFGGAGPLHACEVAERLQIPRVLVPRYPGVSCALGMLMADIVLERGRSLLIPVGAEAVMDMKSMLDQMVAGARDELAREGVAEEAMCFSALVDARYQGQSYELTVPFTESDPEKVVEAFHSAHARQYGHAMTERTVEAVNLRLQATGRTEKPELVPEPCANGDGSEALLGERVLLLRCEGRYANASDERPQGFAVSESPVRLYDRALLRPGTTFAGPALAFQMDSTVFVPPAWSVRVDGYHSLVLEYSQCL